MFFVLFYFVHKSILNIDKLQSTYSFEALWELAAPIDSLYEFLFNHIVS